MGGEGASQGFDGGSGADAGLTRRRLLQAGLAGSALVAIPPFLAACGGSDTAVVEPGGSVRAAFLGGEKDTLKPLAPVTTIDIDRTRHIWDTLGYSDESGVVLRLAESIEPNKDGTVWIVKLRDGVVFHDGSPLTAKDVVYTFQQVLDPRTGSLFTSELAGIDPAKLKPLDRLSLKIELVAPQGDLKEQLSWGGIGIIKEGATDAGRPNGTGPFRFEGFTPGRATQMTRNRNYWATDTPRLDRLELLAIADSQARVNALRGGQADYVGDITPAAAKALDGDKEFALFRGSTLGANLGAFLLNTKVAPFDDNRVRVACKLACDREALIDNALLGFGEVANDNVGLGQALYNDELPQREHDPEQARGLIRAAGAEGTKVTMTSLPGRAGTLESTTLYAEQLKAIGLDVAVDEVDPGTFFGEFKSRIDSLQILAAVNDGGPMVSWFGLTLLPDSPFNVTQWSSPNFARRFEEARATLDARRRKEIMFELQRELWEEGGQIIWSQIAPVDAHRASVSGVEAAGLNTYPVFWNATARG